jgi:hypothetical protein
MTKDDCRCAAGATSDVVPIACDLGAFSPLERDEHLERSREVLSSVERVREEADGFTLAFAVASGLEDEIRLWIQNEQRCCPFLRFDLRNEPATRLVLRISGPAEAKEILRAGLEENGLLRPEPRAG